MVKLQATITDGAPEALFDAFRGYEFADNFCLEIIKILGADEIGPATHHVECPGRAIYLCDGNYGVEVRLTGVSRVGRSAKVFHEALWTLENLVERTVKEALANAGGRKGEQIQIFVVIMLDGEIETQPGSGVYSSVLESEPKWIRDL